MNKNIYKTSIYYEDTDAAGIVYHTSYLRFAERARTELLKNIYPRLLNSLATNKNVFVLTKMDIKFKNFCYLYDKIEVESIIKSFKKTYFNMYQIIKRNKIVICEISSTLVYVNLKKKKPIKMDEELVSRFKKTMYKHIHG